jgi:hypothetical protein
VAWGYSIARSKKARRAYDRARRRTTTQPVGLTGKALEQAMSGILALHPEFLKGYKRPPHLQPRALRRAGRKGQG